jgi:hypothetical protein
LFSLAPREQVFFASANEVQNEIRSGEKKREYYKDGKNNMNYAHNNYPSQNIIKVIK